MRIVFLSSYFWPKIGGVETHTYEIAIRLVRMGHIVDVIAEDHSVVDFKNNRSITRTTKHKGVTIHYFSAGPYDFLKKFRIWKAIFEFSQLFQDADVIHCHDVFIWYAPFRLLYPFKKVFTTFHGYEGICPPSRKAIILRRLSRYLSTKTINIGHFIEKWYGTKADIVLYGGIDKVLPITNVHQKKQLEKNSPTILLVGRLDADIGITTYLNAFRNIKECTFDVCGDGPLRPEVEKLGIVHGFVSNLDAYISKADIVCASSYLTILKALSFGKRVIAVYENSLKKDYLTLAPFSMWITIVGSSAEITREIQDYKKTQKNFSRDEANKLQHYLSRTTWDNVVKQYLTLWKV